MPQGKRRPCVPTQLRRLTPVASLHLAGPKFEELLLCHFFLVSVSPPSPPLCRERFWAINFGYVFAGFCVGGGIALGCFFMCVLSSGVLPHRRLTLVARGFVPAGQASGIQGCRHRQGRQPPGGRQAACQACARQVRATFGADCYDNIMLSESLEYLLFFL